MLVEFSARVNSQTKDSRQTDRRLRITSQTVDSPHGINCHLVLCRKFSITIVCQGSSGQSISITEASLCLKQGGKTISENRNVHKSKSQCSCINHIRAV